MGIFHGTNSGFGITYEGPPRLRQTLFAAIPSGNLLPGPVGQTFRGQDISRLRGLHIGVDNIGNLPAGYSALTEFNTVVNVGSTFGVGIHTQGTFAVGNHDPGSWGPIVNVWKAEGSEPLFAGPIVYKTAFNSRHGFRRRWSRRNSIQMHGQLQGFFVITLHPQGQNPATQWISARYRFNLEWEENF